MRITYVLPRPELGGGNKVVLQHAALLRAAGEEVSVLADGPPPDWIEVGEVYHDLGRGMPSLRSQDLVIATFWTTLAVAERLAIGPTAHFCQGYEGDLPHLRPELPAIEAAYRRPLPTLVVSPHLVDRLRRDFGRVSRVAPPLADPVFRPRLRRRPRRRPWVAVPGIFAAEVKGVATGLETVRRLRRQGVEARLLRFAVLPLSDDERALLEPDRYLCGERPERIAEVLRGADLLLLPSREAEGFGLPLLEAMASGVPAVASRIPSIAGFAAGAAELVAPGDAEAFARAAHSLLRSPRRWRQARRAGLAAVRRFSPAAVTPALLAALGWAAGKG